MADFIARFMKN